MGKGIREKGIGICSHSFARWTCTKGWGTRLWRQPAAPVLAFGQAPRTVFSLFLPLNVRPISLLPGGGEAESIPGTGTHGRQSRGLRLISQ